MGVPDMSDVFTPQKRSEVMSKIRAKNTKPELSVRRQLHALGYRFRLHSPQLPGRPDIVLPRLRLILQVKGCFWHGHRCLGGRQPRQNAGYWTAKLAGNVLRDARNERRLRRQGWSVRTLWECKIRRWNGPQLHERLGRILETRSLSSARHARHQA